MPSNRFNAHTDYGIGIGLRTPHYQHIFNKKPVVDWFEIISENFMVGGGRALANLDQILERYRVVQHGVPMYFGSAEPLNRDHLRRLKALIKRTRTPWLSDHLCWGSVDGTYSHDLLPMPYTFEAAEVTARKVREARDFLEVPIAVENVSSYTEFHMSEMTEWEFLNEVVEQADCGRRRRCYSRPAEFRSRLAPPLRSEIPIRSFPTCETPRNCSRFRRRSALPENRALRAPCAP